MQPSELVSLDDARKAQDVYEAVSATDYANSLDPMQAALEAVALDFYEWGLREAADAAHDALHDAVEEKLECDRLKAVATDAILSKLRSAT